METVVQDKYQLAAKISAFYGEIFTLPPLAAKIHTLLIFDYDRSGYTFDELIKKTGAGKSSVSESLKILSEKQIIISELKNMGRRRFFFINKDFVNVRFNEILNRLRQESEIISEFITILPEEYGDLAARFSIFKNMLDSNYLNIEKSLKKL